MPLARERQDTREEIDIAVDTIRERLHVALSLVETTLRQVRQIVRRHGRAAIGNKLGSTDAQALLNVYAKLKDAVEEGKEVQVEELPDK